MAHLFLGVAESVLTQVLLPSQCPAVSAWASFLRPSLGSNVARFDQVDLHDTRRTCFGMQIVFQNKINFCSVIIYKQLSIDDKLAVVVTTSNSKFHKF